MTVESVIRFCLEQSHQALDTDVVIQFLFFLCCESTLTICFEQLAKLFLDFWSWTKGQNFLHGWPSSQKLQDLLVVGQR